MPNSHDKRNLVTGRSYSDNLPMGYDFELVLYNGEDLFRTSK